jgi:hypothetical protein
MQEQKHGFEESIDHWLVGRMAAVFDAEVSCPLNCGIIEADRFHAEGDFWPPVARGMMPGVHPRSQN